MNFRKPEDYAWYAKRCVLYIRVSTEEQARHGYSLGAQLEELQSFADQFHMQVVGTYTDEGISARKEVRRRHGLCSLLDAVERGETDYVLFIKLDRWFRSVREYYRTQDILDKHNVHWKAILEDYDTSTTNGRLSLNIRLSVAQDESDRTGDRISFINDNRVKNGGVITGSMPIGLRPHNGRVCIDEEKSEAVKGLYSYFEQTGIMRSCIDYMKENHDMLLGYNQIKRMLSNPLYKGEYRDNSSYCQPIIESEQFARVQALLKARGQTRERKYFYMFKGMVVCPECGRKMSCYRQYDKKYDREYFRYRCNKRYVDKACDCTFTPWEKRIEDYLLANIKAEIRSRFASSGNPLQKKGKAKDNTPQIKRKLERLKTLYMEELISLEDYRVDYAELTKQLEKQVAEAPKDKTISGDLAAVLDMDIEKSYPTLSPEEKRKLWVSVISGIVAHDKDTFEIFFL